MSLLGMPWAMLNLGCEMVYILHQRLNAQGIPADKGIKVLQDIIATLLEPGFLADKLFVAQDVYSLASTRKVFDKIAHSSIMKLSENRCAGWRRHAGGAGSRHTTITPAVLTALLPTLCVTSHLSRQHGQAV
jgi:hypothetical protein